ncbi:hypothetical protein PHMEG_0005330 [Phytophthora megakarya]|uniref:Peptidase A2 domain-containing protein n=1 Tax=Phytophthora megakarya TaxID=4795 RepID=A0A225WRH1_9STRA|nr:hypothetical protein PHMEG_0005330 [Phytophthora megakarya]
MDPTPRLDESENSMQWLGGIVYEMKGTHTLPNEWCIAFQLSLRDGAVHWHRALSRKTKRTWSLLSAKFNSYYCSQFRLSASTRYYRAKWLEKKHIRDYLYRLNGYARCANIKFEHSGREAKEHVKHVLETCGDRDLERQLTPMQLRDIHTLEDIVSDIQKVEKRVSNRSSSQRSSRRGNKRHTSSNGSYGRHDSRSRSQERSRSESHHPSRDALVDASVTDLITELKTRASSERPEEYSNEYSNDDPIDFYEGDEADQDECDSDCSSRDEMQGGDTYSDQDECDSDCSSRDEMQGGDTYSDQDERLVAATNDNERRSAANGTFARRDKRPQNNGQQTSGFSQGGFRPATQSGSRFNDNRGGRGFQSSSSGPCAVCGRQNHSTNFCFRRCRLCQQVHDFGKCKAFDELAKILRTTVDKKNISPELQKLVFGCPPSETGLVLTGQSQSADLVIYADCLNAFTGKCEWPEDNNNKDENEKNMEFDGECGVCLDGGTLHEIKEDTTTKNVVNYDWLVSICEANKAAQVHAKTVKLLPVERMGWWSSQRFDRRVRMRALVRGAVNDVWTSNLLDTGANVSIITTNLARRLRLDPIQEHGRQLKVQGIQEGKMSTTTRVKAKVTLGWNKVYEFEF